MKRSILSYCQSIWDGRLFKFNDLPEWMKDNEYITDMHRPQIKNIVSCLRSIFSIHAETGNIWTHLIGALVFLCLIIYTLSRSSEDFVNPFWEKFVYTTFLASAFLCLRNLLQISKGLCHIDGYRLSFWSLTLIALKNNESETEQ